MRYGIGTAGFVIVFLIICEIWDRCGWICLSRVDKPEGFSMFGRRIVSDCGQNSPPGFNAEVGRVPFGNPSTLKLCYLQLGRHLILAGFGSRRLHLV